MSRIEYAPPEHNLSNLTNNSEAIEAERKRREQYFTDNAFPKGVPPHTTPEMIKAKLIALQDLGFTPTAIIQSASVFLEYDINNIADKLSGLKKRGFSDPHKLCLSYPTVLGLNFENIDAKLNGMKDRGFANPVKMVETSPAILGYGFKNIDRRLKLLNRLIELYSLSFSATGLMEKNTALFGVKIDRLVILARIIKEYNVPLINITEKLIGQLIFSNLENVLVARKNTPPESAPINDLMQEIKNTKKEKISKSTKVKIIAQDTNSKDKITRRYFRGYPDKNASNEQVQTEDVSS